jgi:hypothetical protein
MKNEGLPTEPGFYWIINYKGELDIVEIKKTHLWCSPSFQELYGVGYGEDTIENISKVWQRVKPYDLSVEEEEF